MEENRDEYFMRQALFEAKEAYDRDEIPVGVVIVYKDRIIARGHNLTETLNDVTAHAEMQAITSAAGVLGGKYLIGCTVYVTLEPCLTVTALYSGSFVADVMHETLNRSALAGFQKFAPKALHPKTEIQGGVLQEDCARLMQDFFRNKR